MAGERKTPVQLARDLGVRPQLIYGLIRQKRIHTYGERPQMVDVAEVKSVMSTVKHREPKEAVRGRQPARGTILGKRTKGNAVRHTVVTGATLPQDGDPTDYMGILHTTDTRRRDEYVWDAPMMSKLIKARVVKIEGPNELFGMLVYHYEMQGDADRATALEEFCIQVLEVTPYRFESTGEDPKDLKKEDTE